MSGLEVLVVIVAPACWVVSLFVNRVSGAGMATRATSSVQEYPNATDVVLGRNGSIQGGWT